MWEAPCRVFSLTFLVTWLAVIVAALIISYRIWHLKLNKYHKIILQIVILYLSPLIVFFVVGILEPGSLLNFNFAATQRPGHIEQIFDVPAFIFIPINILGPAISGFEVTVPC